MASCEIRIIGCRQGTVARQAVNNLFERPAVREQVQDAGAQAREDYELSRLAWLMGPALCSLMGGHRSIGDRQGVVAKEFSRDRGLGAWLSAGAMARRLDPPANRRLHASRFTKLKR